MRKIIQVLGREKFVFVITLSIIILALSFDYVLAYSLNHQFNYKESFIRLGLVILLTVPYSLWQLSAGFFELDKLENQVKNLSAYDELTGLLNKSTFYRSVEKLHKISIRNKQSYCILLVDIDNFKEIINKYGQATGEKILSIFGQLSREVVRDSDIIARIGNNDFTFFLPNTNLEQAEALSNRFIDNMRKKAVINDNKYIQYTASIGIAVNTSNELQSLEETITMAKDALDRAKSEGGNTMKNYYH